MKIGFIGFGNMAKAMLSGMISNGVCHKENVMVSGLHKETLEIAKNEFGVSVTFQNKEVMEHSDVIFLAVKPQYYGEVISEIQSYINGNQILISLAPGKTIAWLEELFKKDVKLIRTMPNTPALVGEGMTGVCKNDYLQDKDFQKVLPLFKSFGKVEIVPEALMDVVVGISGSAPAYVFMMIEAMADAAVMAGMKRDVSYRFASQAVLGSAKMVLDTKTHPGELKDMVCSPGGTTIKAVASLEKNGFRNALIEGVTSCIKKSKEM